MTEPTFQRSRLKTIERKRWFLPAFGCVLIAIASGCESGSDVQQGGAPDPAVPTRTNMALPGIGIEVEDGLVFDAVYDPATKTAAAEFQMAGTALYESELVSGTQVPGFQVTVDLGESSRTLELVTGPWEATFERQARVISWVGAFHAAIQAAAEARGTQTVDYFVAPNGHRRSLKSHFCAELDDVVQRFIAATGVELVEVTLPEQRERFLFVCRKKEAKDFVPQANYGVKLAAFVEGGVARDFGGRPGRSVIFANGEARKVGPGCVLGPKNRAALVEATLMSVAPEDKEAFCRPYGAFNTAECGAPFAQPAYPCFPLCMMGQICYGIATDSIWTDGSTETASSVLCASGAEDCRAAARRSYRASLPEVYATLLGEDEVAAWTEEERVALRALLIYNRCGALIHALSPVGLSIGCYQSFWEKQAMGSLPKAKVDEFKPYLPQGFDSAGGRLWSTLEPVDPSFTTLDAYVHQVCDHALVLGETARQGCREVARDMGLRVDLGGKEISLFRIGEELAMVVESRHATLYVAGGYQGVRGEDGVVKISEGDLRDTINYVRTLNGFNAESSALTEGGMD